MSDTSKSRREEADLVNEAAVAAWSNGREKEAFVYVEQCLDMDPDNVFAWINRYYFEASVKAGEVHDMNRAGRRVEKVVESDSPSSPEVSVILPTYRRTEFFKEALASVLAQTMKDFEVVVVNDGGPPDAEDVCRAANDDRVRYALITHSGLSGALNAGLEMAKGKYAAYLDDDDLYKPAHLETLLNAVRNESDGTVIYSDAEKIVGEKSPDGWVWSEPEPFYREDYSRPKLMTHNFIHNQCALHRRETALEVGGYHEGINFAINWEMWIKLGARYPFKRVPEITVVYRDRKTGDTMSTDPSRKRQHSRNIILYAHRILTLRRSSIKNAARLERALKNMLDMDPDIIDLLDMRKIVAGKPYYMFYELGKNFAASGMIEEAKTAFKTAAYVAPWELRSYAKWLSLVFGSKGKSG